MVVTAVDIRKAMQEPHERPSRKITNCLLLKKCRMTQLHTVILVAVTLINAVLSCLCPRGIYPCNPPCIRYPDYGGYGAYYPVPVAPVGIAGIDSATGAVVGAIIGGLAGLLSGAKKK
ncbi:unnamed protein product [Cylicocyclus nassatus]|uniref:Uncharacterized protein n=1 Tax=Cylicocyclus nassatus TaxID=53992 RepID=A0AA36DRC3_CYLNA|nr:unnamed protein product [Cylicocyclus nassatus]